jgi:hypothetical protein
MIGPRAKVAGAPARDRFRLAHTTPPNQRFGDITVVRLGPELSRGGRSYSPRELASARPGSRGCFAVKAIVLGILDLL